MIDPALLSEDDVARLSAELGEVRLRYCPQYPTLKQEWFLLRDELEVFFGGAAGPGKSTGLLMAGLQYVDVTGYHAILLRPTLSEFEQPGGLIEMSHDWLANTDAWWHGGRRQWSFPKGATLRFGYLRTISHLQQYKGPSYSFAGFDELTSFTEALYRGMFRILRQPLTGPLENVPVRMRAASNPGGIGHAFVKARFIEAASRAAGAVFVPAKITDNPHLDYATYLKTLGHLSLIDQLRLINGDWDVTEEGEVFDRDKIKVIDTGEAKPALKSVRYWDLAGTKPGPTNSDPDWTVGVLLEATVEGRWTVRHVQRFREEPGEVERRVKRQAEEDGRFLPVYIEQDPGQAGKPVSDDASVLMGDGSYRPLRDVCVHDEVIGASGQPRRVLAVHVQGELETVRLHTASGRVLEAALDHPVLTAGGWKNAVEIRPEETLALLASTEARPSVFRPPEEYRLAGYFVGDGSCGPASSGGASICADITCHDPLERADIEHCVATLGFELREGRRGKLLIRNGVRGWLREIGLAGKRAYDKTVPEWVFQSPDELIAEFVGAYFACDGHITRGRDGRGIEFYSISRELLVGVQRLLLRFGINSKLREKKGRYRETRHISYRLSLLISDDAQARFAERIPVRGEKAEWLPGIPRSRFDERFISDTVTRVEAGTAACRCLSVEDDETFTAEDIVVHNSQLSHYQRVVLNGYACHGGQTKLDGRNAAKEVRSRPVAAAVNNGHVEIVAGENVREFLDTLAIFPNGTHDDDVDALAGAFNILAGRVVKPATTHVARGRIAGVADRRSSPLGLPG